MNKPKVLSYDELKNAVNAKGFNWTLIAEVIGVSQQHVIRVAQLKSNNVATARAIQTAAELPFVTIFGVPQKEYEAKCISRCTIPAADLAARKAKLAQALSV